MSGFNDEGGVGGASASGSRRRSRWSDGGWADGSPRGLRRSPGRDGSRRGYHGTHCRGTRGALAGRVSSAARATGAARGIAAGRDDLTALRAALGAGANLRCGVRAAAALRAAWSFRLARRLSGPSRLRPPPSPGPAPFHASWLSRQIWAASGFSLAMPLSCRRPACPGRRLALCRLARDRLRGAAFLAVARRTGPAALRREAALEAGADLVLDLAMRASPFSSASVDSNSISGVSSIAYPNSGRRLHDLPNASLSDKHIMGPPVPTPIRQSIDRGGLARHVER